MFSTKAASTMSRLDASGSTRPQLANSQKFRPTNPTKVPRLSSTAPAAGSRGNTRASSKPTNSSTSTSKPRA